MHRIHSHLAQPLLAAGLLALLGCAAAVPATPRVQHEAVHWGYSGAGAPERWGTLTPDFALCGTGTMQSPIDLSNATRADLADLRFDYAATPLRMINLGHTLQVNHESGSALMVGPARYELVQFHFHTPAEHRLQGRELPAELHLVHRGPAGDLAVVGVLIERGSEHPAARPLVSIIPRSAGAESEMLSHRINANDLLPATREHFRYPGSLTTPPCSEGVTWLVLNGTIQFSDEQLRAIRSAIGTSNRPVQPLGSRQLRLGM